MVLRRLLSLHHRLILIAVGLLVFVAAVVGHRLRDVVVTAVTFVNNAPAWRWALPTCRWSLPWRVLEVVVVVAPQHVYASFAIVAAAPYLEYIVVVEQVNGTVSSIVIGGLAVASLAPCTSPFHLFAFFPAFAIELRTLSSDVPTLPTVKACASVFATTLLSSGIDSPSCFVLVLAPVAISALSTGEVLAMRLLKEDLLLLVPQCLVSPLLSSW